MKLIQKRFEREKGDLAKEVGVLFGSSKVHVLQQREQERTSIKAGLAGLAGEACSAGQIIVKADHNEFVFNQKARWELVTGR
jgi:hypothetical protein